MIGIREGRIYKLLTPLAQALVHLEVSPCELWHKIFGPLYYKVLPTLNSIVNGIPELKENHGGVCKGCALDKNTKRPFGSSASRSKEILDLIHSDVCGLMTPKSLRGHLYYVTFIDDHSRKTWVYLMKSKDEVFIKFQEFTTRVKNLTERRIKILRPDNGGEYTTKEIIAFCKESWIKRELIVPYNPEKNGVLYERISPLKKA